MDMKSIVRELFVAIDRIETIRTSLNDGELNEEQAFHAGFAVFSKVVRPCINSLGLHFDYYDPDTTYREDFLAMADAVIAFRPIVQALL